VQKQNPPLALLCSQIEKTLNWGASSLWTEQDFEELSEKIDEKTQVRLSISTLKRIWGRVRYESTPNTVTLNALAKFLGYGKWRDFLKMNSEDKSLENQVMAIPANPKEFPLSQASPLSSIKQFFLPLMVGLGMVIVCLGLIALLGNKGPTNSRSQDLPLQFESREVSDELPNSVVFDYDATAYHSDSVYIQQNWDPNRREKVPGNGRHHTSIYYFPGFFKAKLIIDGQIKKESEIFIQSKGWIGIVGEKPVPIYLSPDEMKLKNALGISAQTLIQKTSSSVFNDQWVYFTNVRTFKGLDPAHFSFSISLRNSSSLEQSPCRKLKVLILGKESAIIIPLAAKGCISDLSVLTGQRLINGKENDLSRLGCDFSNFQQLYCQVEDQRLKIYLNDQLVMNEEQPQTIGDIIGLRIGFEGTGEIKGVNLSSAGKIIYSEQFNH
jgi:hypothetical protein